MAKFWHKLTSGVFFTFVLTSNYDHNEFAKLQLDGRYAF